MKWLSLVVALLLSALAGADAAHAADALAGIGQRAAKAAVLRGDFTQEKRIAGFKNPLRSQGRFVLSREKGVVWTTVAPFPSEMVITHDRILSRQRDGSTRVEADGRQQSAVRSVNAMMFALMSGDVRVLSSRFHTQAQLLPDDGWRLSLMPKTRALEQSFRRIELSGDRYVREVEIEEGNGDRTRLVFTGLTENPARLSADEARHFD